MFCNEARFGDRDSCFEIASTLNGTRSLLLQTQRKENNPKLGTRVDGAVGLVCVLSVFLQGKGCQVEVEFRGWKACMEQDCIVRNS